MSSAWERVVSQRHTPLFSSTLPDPPSFALISVLSFNLCSNQQTEPSEGPGTASPRRNSSSSSTCAVGEGETQCKQTHASAAFTKPSTSNHSITLVSRKHLKQHQQQQQEALLSPVAHPPPHAAKTAAVDVPPSLKLSCLQQAPPIAAALACKV